MEKVTLQNLIEISIQELHSQWYNEDDDPELDAEDYEDDDNEDDDCDDTRVYFDIKKNADKIYVIPSLPSHADHERPDSYLVLFKDGRKVVMDAGWPQFDDGHVNVSDMHITTKDLIGADANNPNYEITIPKGSLVYELHADGNSFIALSPDLKQGLTTPGSSNFITILGKNEMIFDEYAKDEYKETLEQLSNDKGNKRDFKKYDFIIMD